MILNSAWNELFSHFFLNLDMNCNFLWRCDFRSLHYFAVIFSCYFFLGSLVEAFAMAAFGEYFYQFRFKIHMKWYKVETTRKSSFSVCVPLICIVGISAWQCDRFRIIVFSYLLKCCCKTRMAGIFFAIITLSVDLCAEPKRFVSFSFHLSTSVFRFPIQVCSSFFSLSYVVRT